MGDVDFKVFVGVGFTGVAVHCEGFPLGRKRGVGDEVGEGWRRLGWCRLGWCGGSGWGEWDGGPEWERWRESCEGDVGCKEVVWVVRWGMGSV